MRTIQGMVVSTKMEKTIVVAVTSEVSHPKYHKKYKVTKKFHAHDENNSCTEGDMVTISETRPLSKLKRWELVVTGEEAVKATPKKPVAKKAAPAKKTVTPKKVTKKPAVKKVASAKKTK